MRRLRMTYALSADTLPYSRDRHIAFASPTRRVEVSVDIHHRPPVVVACARTTT